MYEHCEEQHHESNKNPSTNSRSNAIIRQKRQQRASWVYYCARNEGFLSC